MNIMEGFLFRASMKSCLTNFSDSPCQELNKRDGLTLKKVKLASLAHAIARNVLPVPGGPYRRIADGAILACLKYLINLEGHTTAYCRAFLAVSRPATSSQLTLGF